MQLCNGRKPPLVLVITTVLLCCKKKEKGSSRRKRIMRSSAGSVRAQLILLLSAEECKWKPSHWPAEPLASRARPPLMEHSVIITGTVCQYNAGARLSRLTLAGSVSELRGRGLNSGWNTRSELMGWSWWTPRNKTNQPKLAIQQWFCWVSALTLGSS